MSHPAALSGWKEGVVIANLACMNGYRVGTFYQNYQRRHQVSVPCVSGCSASSRPISLMPLRHQRYQGDEAYNYLRQPAAR